MEEELTIFLSWSGPTSRTLAQFLKNWLKQVLPGIDGWISSEDIRSGDEWFAAVRGALRKARAGIICLTPENTTSPWIYFETGFLATNLTVVCPYLLGIGPEDLGSFPLSFRQCTQAESQEATWKLVEELNGLLKPPEDTVTLRKRFDENWPVLRDKLKKLVTKCLNPGVPPTYSDQMYLIGARTIPYVEVAGSTRDGYAEYTPDGIRVRYEDTPYRLPQPFHFLADPECAPENRCGVSLFTPERMQAGGAIEPPTFYFRLITYEDHLRVSKNLDRPIPKNPSRTFRQEYAPHLAKPDLLYTYQLPNACGIGCFVITSDSFIVVSERSLQVKEVAGRLSYSSSGGMHWQNSVTPFGEMVREIHEELHIHIEEQDLRLYSVGIDAERLVVQCSFVAGTDMTFAQLSDEVETAQGRREYRKLHAVGLDVKSIAEIVRSGQWEYPALAGIVTLAKKRLGVSEVDAALL